MTKSIWLSFLTHILQIISPNVIIWSFLPLNSSSLSCKSLSHRALVMIPECNKELKERYTDRNPYACSIWRETGDKEENRLTRWKLAMHRTKWKWWIELMASH